MANKEVKFTPAQLKAMEMRLAREKYCDYVRYVHRGKWTKSRLGSFICNEVQKFIEEKTGHPYDILIISMPPQHGKSQSITETLPSWYLGRYKDNRVIEISYNTRFARKFGRYNKRKIEEFGKDLFGIEISPSASSDENFELAGSNGSMISRGALSGVTGNPADLMIIDDPIKNRAEADSETHREKIWNEWTDSFRSRLSAGAKVILIQTRWHEDDLAGRIIDLEKNYRVLNLPCEAEENDLLGRAVGEPLHPEIGKDKKWLKQFKATMIKTEGSRTWNSLYQGHPVAEEGNLVHREWWKYYTELPSMNMIVISVDASFKNTNNSDYVAIQVWGKSNCNYYLIDRIKKRLSFTETVQHIRFMRSKYPSTSAVFIEDKANGSAIIDVLRKECPYVIPVNPLGGKEARVNAISPVIESGSCFLPATASWTVDFVNEFAAFPNGAHDDEVDACSQALNKLVFQYTKINNQQKIEQEETILSSTRRIIGTKVKVKPLLNFSKRRF